MTHSRTIEAPAVIIGGGIVGGATAYYLARRGIRAVLLEKSSIGSEASGRNAGGVRAQCRNRLERRLAMASIELWAGLEAELGVDMEYTQGGNIRLAAHEDRLAQLSAEAEEELADGLRVEVWDRDQLRRRAPYLSDLFIGAKYCASDGIANPILATWGLALAAGRAGATLLAHTEAVDIEVQSGQVTAVVARNQVEELRIETPRLIHIGGPWTPKLAQTLGIHIPVEPARNFIGVTQPMPPLFTEFLSSHDLSLYARPARKGHIHIGAVGVANGTFDQSVPAEALAHLARGALMIPALRSATFLRTWAGTLAMTPDHLPIIGPVEGIQGYLLAAGFSGHGFCLGPIVGKLLSELVADGEPSISLAALNLSRFKDKAPPKENTHGGGIT
ncbi:MAG: FAD-binding oxidoreductase [Chloroflexota bacterium]